MQTVHTERGKNWMEPGGANLQAGDERGVSYCQEADFLKQASMVLQQTQGSRTCRC